MGSIVPATRIPIKLLRTVSKRGTSQSTIVFERVLCPKRVRKATILLSKGGIHLYMKWTTRQNPSSTHVGINHGDGIWLYRSLLIATSMGWQAAYSLESVLSSAPTAVPPSLSVHDGEEVARARAQKRQKARARRWARPSFVSCRGSQERSIRSAALCPMMVMLPCAWHSVPASKLTARRFPQGYRGMLGYLFP